jgi:hypothetical protein
MVSDAGGQAITASQNHPARWTVSPATLTPGHSGESLGKVRPRTLRHASKIRPTSKKPSALVSRTRFDWCRSGEQRPWSDRSGWSGLVWSGRSGRGGLLWGWSAFGVVCFGVVRFGVVSRDRQARGGRSRSGTAQACWWTSSLAGHREHEPCGSEPGGEQWCDGRQWWRWCDGRTAMAHNWTRGRERATTPRRGSSPPPWSASARTADPAGRRHKR